MPDIPFYVTRKTANGKTGSFSGNIYFMLFLMLLIQVNVALWGIAGIYMFFKVMF